jgi:hypothetical protein
LDSQNTLLCNPKISRSDISKFAQIQDWFDSLGECLHWNVRKQQKNFETDLASLDSQEVAAALEDDKANA